MDLLKMAKQMGQMQAGLKQARAALAKMTVAGESRQGGVTVELTGAMEVHRVRIDPALLNTLNAPQLEQRLTEALTDALQKVQRTVATQMAPLTGGLNPFA